MNEKQYHTCTVGEWSLILNENTGPHSGQLFYVIWPEGLPAKLRERFSIGGEKIHGMRGWVFSTKEEAERVYNELKAELESTP